jgi:hypothetical protein
VLVSAVWLKAEKEDASLHATIAAAKQLVDAMSANTQLTAPRFAIASKERLRDAGLLDDSIGKRRIIVDEPARPPQPAASLESVLSSLHLHLHPTPAAAPLARVPPSAEHGIVHVQTKGYSGREKNLTPQL